ncbi:AraC family transcriptional regulator [Paenibacillus sp. GCM10023248]|uniref:AraC family transcriptional regulator n=1 Tax=unclassified Paenibacillus TaxID=185978 RepID=UPI00237998A7|nr:AraC family transcriptional regulator [Paenibacillus sp. MAHUQ-63]MDD9271991.1 AraC family transcriptional regulator [Paenibacillus sp. MAHUQ-63]
MWMRWRQRWYWWTHRSGRGNFYRRSLILVLCITSLPTVIIGYTSYITGRTHIEKEIMHNHDVLLKKTMDRMNDNLAQLELAATQWSLDSRMGSRLAEINLKDEYNTTQNLYRFLGLMKGAYPLIEQAQLYLDRQDPVMISDIDGIVPLTSEQDRDIFHTLMEQKRGVFWWESLPKVNGKPGASYIALIEKLPSVGEPYGALILYLDREKLVQMVEEMTIDNNGASFLMSKDGHIIVSQKNAGEAHAELESAVRESVVGRTEDIGSHILEHNGASYSVSYGQFFRSGTLWKFVTATSLSELTAPVEFMSRSMLSIGGIGLLVAVLLSWVASKRIYKPIMRLVNVIKDYKPTQESQGDELAFIEREWKHLSQESRALESKLDQAYPALRSAFLLQLVQGHFYSLSETELRGRLESFDWPTDSQWFALLLVQISGFAKGDGRFLENEEQLATFAAANIAQEMVKMRSYNAEIMNFQDMTVGVLVSYPMDRTKQQVKDELYLLADDMGHTISSLLKIQTTVCMGNLTSQVQDLPQLLVFLRSAIRYRDLKADHQVLDLEEMLPSANDDVHYPFALEKELMQAIRMGQNEQSLQLIECFVQELVRQSSKEKLLQDGVMQVLGSMLHTMLESGYNPHHFFEGYNLYEQLNQLREPEQIVRFFQQKVITPYLAGLNEYQDIHMRRLVERVTDRLHERFMNSDISLEECAEAFNTTTYALSKAFKMINGVNFIDYLISLRMDKAKKLLVESDLKVNEIAEMIGYQPSYFIRLFRKYENMTPGQYRDKGR